MDNTGFFIALKVVKLQPKGIASLNCSWAKLGYIVMSEDHIGIPIYHKEFEFSDIVKEENGFLEFRKPCIMEIIFHLLAC